MLIRCLVAVDDDSLRRRLRRLLVELGAVGRVTDGNQHLWERLQARPFDMVIADRQNLPEPIEETVAAVRALPGQPEVVVVGTVRDRDQRAALLANGCLAVLSAKLGDDTLRASLNALLRRRQESGVLRLEREQSDEYRLGDFVSRSPAMRQLIETAQKVAASNTTALILGETGTGKEALARALHSEGPRGTRAFVAVNCAAIPETLFESELFGHTRGAFTGAAQDRRGHFEMAHEGTIFLDEVADLPAYLQVKMLRVLQERVIQRVGSERSIEIDVRLLAATNRSPMEEIESGRLREDLFYRIGVVTLEIPPLRERTEDIPDLVTNYFEIFRTRIGRRLLHIDPDVIDALTNYAWPGNVRELINLMERAVLLSSGDTLRLRDLTDEVVGARATVPSYMRATDVSMSPDITPLRDAKRMAIDAFERDYLADVLRRTHGRIGKAAALAGISTRSLYQRMRRLGLTKEMFSDF